MSKLSHVDASGKPTMVDVTHKTATDRRATAEGLLLIKPAHRAAIGALPKGDAISIAEIAGVMGAKRTSELIPLCHPISLSHVSVSVTLEAEGLRIKAITRTSAQTGVEMEAYMAVAIAGVTLIDMLKGVDPDLTLTDIRLLEKTGGKAPWRRESAS